MSTIIDMAEDRAAAKQQALDTLSAGSVVVLPVGGVYAIVADAFRTAATQRIFAARRRSRITPLPVLLRSDRQIGALAADIPDYADRLIEAFWPGGLTLIVPATQDLSWDLGNGKGTVQLRQPADDFLRELIGEVGPLACTSANRLDQPRPTTVEEAKGMLGVLVPVYLDGGPLDGHVSTIVDATGPQAVVHREGVISTDHVMIVASGELPLGERPAADAVYTPADADGDADAYGDDDADADGAADEPDGDADAGQPDGDAGQPDGDADADGAANGSLGDADAGLPDGDGDGGDPGADGGEHGGSAVEGPAAKGTPPDVAADDAQRAAADVIEEVEELVEEVHELLGETVHPASEGDSEDHSPR